MTEFTKMKISFALALLGTLFALHPFLDRFDERGFLYLGYDLKIFYAYSLTAGLLSLCVYLYALSLMGDRTHSWIERAGNYVYALAILIVPIYAGLFLSARLADEVALSHVAWAAPAVAVGLGAGWIAFTQLVAWRIRGRLGARDRAAKIAQLAEQEIKSLKAARDLFESEHYDLSVIEAWRALEARLRQALLSRKITAPMETSHAVIHVATRKGIVQAPILDVIDELRHHWSIAVSAEPLPREAAVKSLSAVRHLLSIVHVHEPSFRHAPAPRTPRAECASRPAFAHHQVA
jgi:HEPN domain-containing protein